MKLARKVTEQELPLAYLTALNGMLNLTEKELLVLSVIAGKSSQLSESILSEDLMHKFLFSSDTRKEMAKISGISFPAFNAMLKQLKDKKILIDNTQGDLSLSKGLTIGRKIEFTFEIVPDEIRRPEAAGDLQESSTAEQPDNETGGGSTQVSVQVSTPSDEGVQDEAQKADS